MSEQVFTKPLKFTYSMWKFVGALRYIDKLDLGEDLKEKIFQARSEDYGHFVEDLAQAFRSSANEFELHSAKRELREGMARRWRVAVEDSFPILLNQGLVMSCSIFESFLVDCFTALAPFARGFLMKEADWDKELETEDSGLDSDEIARTTEATLVKRFERSTINDKISELKRLRIDLDAVLEPELAISQVLRLTGSSASDLLLKLYGNRNDVVHRGMLVLEVYDHLGGVYDILRTIMLGVALSIRTRYGIPTDLDLIGRDPKLADSLWK